MTQSQDAYAHAQRTIELLARALAKAHGYDPDGVTSQVGVNVWQSIANAESERAQGGAAAGVSPSTGEDNSARRPIGHQGVSLEDARRALASYYSEAPEAEKAAFRSAWMAEIEDEYIATPPTDGPPRLSVSVKGVGRDSEMARTILVYCDGRPGDDDLRILHDWLCGRPIHATLPPTMGDAEMIRMTPARTPSPTGFTEEEVERAARAIAVHFGRSPDEIIPGYRVRSNEHGLQTIPAMPEWKVCEPIARAALSTLTPRPSREGGE
jgi:hypothetical protein